jgi:hypothetical protein
MAHARITRPDQCYDVINMSDEMIADYLQEEGNIILTDPRIIRPICYTVDYIERQMNDPENVFYECHPTTRQVNLERPIVRLTGVSDYYVLGGDLRHALNQPITWKWMTFEPLEMSGPLMSESARHGTAGSYVSALHCQEGSQRQLSTIITFTTDVNQPEIQQHQTPEETNARVQSVRQMGDRQSRQRIQQHERQERQRIQRREQYRVTREHIERQFHENYASTPALEVDKYLLVRCSDDVDDCKIIRMGKLRYLAEEATRLSNHDITVFDLLDADESEYLVYAWNPSDPQLVNHFHLTEIRKKFVLFDIEAYGPLEVYQFDDIDTARARYDEINNDPDNIDEGLGGVNTHALHLYEITDNGFNLIVTNN